MLLGHLPRESSYVVAMVGEQARWSDAEYLLAHVADAMNVSNYIAKIGFRVAGNHQPPEPFDRPGRAGAQRRRSGNRKLTPAQLRKRLGMKDR